MFTCDYKKLRLSFNEFFDAESKKTPDYDEFCLLELKDGRFTAGRWCPDDYEDKESFSGCFIRGTADTIEADQVAKWHSLSNYDLTECLEDAKINKINLGAKKENAYTRIFKGFKSLKDKRYPKEEQYCLLILSNGGLAGGRWNKLGRGKGLFIYAPALASYGMDEVWAWTALSSDEFFEIEQEEERERKQEKEQDENPQESVKASDPKLKFKYGLDIEVYLKMAYDNVKKDYRWLNKTILKDAWRYAIKQVDGEWEFVSACKGKRKYTVCDCDSAERFIENVEHDYRNTALRANPAVATYALSFGSIEIHGWYLERYEFSRLKTGDYKALVQAGNRTTGGTREFFITPYCFEAKTYEEFLDRYLEIVPGRSFGLNKEDLLSDEKLKTFLGY